MPRASEPRTVTPRLLREWPLPEPGDSGDKHDRGTVLVVGGSDSTPGAVLLAGLAALRAGGGRLQVATVRSTQAALGVSLPEARVLGLAAASNGSLSPDAADDVVAAAEGASVVVVGPGLLGTQETGTLLELVLPRLSEEAAVVLDAVALTALAKRPHLTERLTGRLVLTPNSGEMAALAGGDESLSAHDVAARYGAVVAARGIVSCPDGAQWADEAGGIGLGTSGSGDVLAGVVAGLLARGCEPAQAAVWGQYVHAAAGDRLAARVGRTGFLARELLDELVPVLSGLRS
ncbi:MAG: NAD(P)H-hydrate dehydratase [Frankiales bacterium]|nr:NAD(P)H-hydrate dehydratase [Frankiales bacterium]